VADWVGGDAGRPSRGIASTGEEDRMSNRRRIMRRRAAAAYRIMRGRPPKPDYGILVILPLLAAFGGVLISRGIESFVDRRRDARPAGTTPEPVRV
jgi:hypothetical protein